MTIFYTPTFGVTLPIDWWFAKTHLESITLSPTACHWIVPGTVDPLED